MVGNTISVPSPDHEVIPMYGISLTYSNHNNLTNNTITFIQTSSLSIGFAQSGISIARCQSNTLMNNTIIGDWEQGLDLSDTSNNTIVRNHISQNEDGLILGFISQLSISLIVAV